MKARTVFLSALFFSSFLCLKNRSESCDPLLMMFHNGIILIVNCFFCPAKVVISYRFANYFLKFEQNVLICL